MTNLTTPQPGPDAERGVLIPRDAVIEVVEPVITALTTRAERAEADLDGARSEYQRLRGVNRALLEDFDRVVKERDAALAREARLREAAKALTDFCDLDDDELRSAIGHRSSTEHDDLHYELILNLRAALAAPSGERE